MFAYLFLSKHVLNSRDISTYIMLGKIGGILYIVHILPLFHHWLSEYFS